MVVAFKILIVVILVVVFAQAAYTGYFYWRASRLAKTVYTGFWELGDPAQPMFRFLVSGDSIAAGVGASSMETSLGGHIAVYLAQTRHVYYTNNAKSGAKTADLLSRTFPGEPQDLTLIMISSNDVIHFTSYASFEAAVAEVLRRYAPGTKHLIIAGPGRVSRASIFPLPLRWLYGMREPRYQAIMERAAAAYPNITYLSPDTILSRLQTTGFVPTKARSSSPDKLHAGDAGQAVWLELLRPELDALLKE